MDKTVLNTIKVVLTVLGVLAVGAVLYRLASVFMILFISLFVVLSVEPAIKFLMKQDLLNKPISRGIAVTFTYLGLVLALLLIITLGFPPVLGQTQKLLTNAGNLIASVPIFKDLEIPTSEIIPRVSEVSGKILAGTVSAFSTFASIITVIILSIYVSLDWENIKKWFYSMFRGRTNNMVVDVVMDIEKTIGAWVKGQLTLMFFIGFLSFLAILVLGIDYPLAIGLVAGLLEIVPILGPLISADIAALIGFSISPATGIGALILFWAIQQVENSYLIPRIMGKVSGFSPIIVLLAILVAAAFFGPVGVIVAIPVTMSAVIIFRRVLGISNL